MWVITILHYNYSSYCKCSGFTFTFNYIFWSKYRTNYRVDLNQHWHQKAINFMCIKPAQVCSKFDHDSSLASYHEQTKWNKTKFNATKRNATKWGKTSTHKIMSLRTCSPGLWVISCFDVLIRLIWCSHDTYINPVIHVPGVHDNKLSQVHAVFGRFLILLSILQYMIPTP